MMRVLRIMVAQMLLVVAGCNGQQASSTAAGHTRQAAAPGQSSVVSDPAGDLAAQISNALKGLNGSCGRLTIPQGTYAWNSTVVLNPCQSLEAHGVVARVAHLSAPALVIAGKPVYNSATQLNPVAYTEGSLDGLTLQGPGPQAFPDTVGIYFGGDIKNGEITPKNYLAYLFNFRDVHLTGFATGLRFGVGFQTAWFGGSIENNRVGIDFDDQITGLENIAFYATQILNNLNQGIRHASAGLYVDLNCFGCSLDYNGRTGKTPEVDFINGHFRMYSGHLEGPQMPMVRALAPVVGGDHADLYFDGVSMSRQTGDKTIPLDAFIDEESFGNSIQITKPSFQTDNEHIAAIVRMAQANGAPVDLKIDNYSDSLFDRPNAIPAFAGKAPDTYDYYTYGSHGKVIAHMTSSPQALPDSSLNTGRTCTVNGFITLPRTDGQSVKLATCAP